MIALSDGEFHLAALLLDLMPLAPGLGAHGVFPFDPQGAHEHLAARRVGIREGDAGVGKDQLALLIGVLRAARFDDRQRAVALAAVERIRDLDPGVRDCRNVQCRGFQTGVGAFEQAGEEHGDACVAAKVDEPLGDGARCQSAAHAGERRERVDGDAARTVRGDVAFDAHEMLFRGRRLRADRFHPQQAAREMGREVHAHRGEVADDVAGVFIERDEERPLAAPAGRFDEGAGEH